MANVYDSVTRLEAIRHAQFGCGGDEKSTRIILDLVGWLDRHQAAEAQLAIANLYIRLGNLEDAVRAVYYAAHWTPDRECNADKLWTKLRDAAHLVPGQAPKPKAECICGGQEAAKAGLPRLSILCPVCDRTSGECP